MSGGLTTPKHVVATAATHSQATMTHVIASRTRLTVVLMQRWLIDIPQAVSTGTPTMAKPDSNRSGALASDDAAACPISTNDNSAASARNAHAIATAIATDAPVRSRFFPIFATMLK